jgi:glycosyltransferase involved in cell wall biosynthesis
MQSGLISIIIPTFNRAHLLPEALDSIIAQTYSDWECIIVDDGSTDNTDEVVNNFIEGDNRFKFYKRSEERIKGANACRNFGFEVSSGEYINWFDSDDVLLPNFLKYKMDIFQKDNNLDAVFSYGAYFEGKLEVKEVSKPNIDYTDILSYVNCSFYLATPGPLWKRAFLDNKDLFEESRQKIQDTEFHFRMLLTKVKFQFYHKDYLFLIRRGVNRISSNKSLNTNKLEDVLRYHFLTFTSSEIADSKYEKKYLCVTSNNVFKSFYELQVHQKSIKSRYRLYKKHKSKINLIFSKLQLPWKSKIKIHLGLLLIVIFKKGYTLLTV